MRGKILVITGVSTTGKTEVAFELARKINGEIICGDQIQQIKGFPISTGSSDIFKYKNVPYHFYENLNPRSACLNPNKYVRVIGKIVRTIFKRRRVPIIEGASLGYVEKFIQENKVGLKYYPVIGLRLDRNFNLKRMMRKRLNQALKEGLLKEIKRGLKNGYGDCDIMKTTVVIPPLVEYLQGGITLTRAKKIIIDGGLNWAKKKQGYFEKISDIQWVTNNPKKPQLAVTKILKILGE